MLTIHWDFGFVSFFFWKKIAQLMRLHRCCFKYVWIKHLKHLYEYVQCNENVSQPDWFSEFWKCLIGVVVLLFEWMWLSVVGFVYFLSKCPHILIHIIMYAIVSLIYCRLHWFNEPVGCGVFNVSSKFRNSVKSIGTADVVDGSVGW